MLDFIDFCSIQRQYIINIWDRDTNRKWTAGVHAADCQSTLDVKLDARLTCHDDRLLRKDLLIYLLLPWIEWIYNYDINLRIQELTNNCPDNFKSIPWNITVGGEIQPGRVRA